MIGTDWGVGQVFLTIFWLTVFVIWIMLLFNVFQDIFRSHDISGLVKALWVVFVIVFPYIGVFLYVAVRGHKMSEHALIAAQQNETAVHEYIRHAAGASPVDELTKLAALKEQGVIDDAEFRRLKAKIVA